LARDFETLGLTARERGRWLSETQVAEPDLLALPECLAELLLAGKRADRFVHRELEDVVDCAAVDAHVEHLGLEALAAAIVARHVDVRHEDHLDLEIPRALAGLTAAAGDIEAESARAVAALPAHWCVGEDAADLVECLDVGDGIRARRLADRTLIDHDNVVERLDSRDRVERANRLTEVLLRAMLAVDAQLERAHEH